MDRRTALTTLAALALGCRRSEGDVLCFAAASTRDALTEIAKGTSVRFGFGGSGDLARQILAGAPADLFLSADAARVDQLEQAGLVASRHDLLGNRLVVVVASASKLSSPADLPSVGRLAMGDPATVPAGTYGKKWLEAQGLWSAVAKHVVPTLDVRAALSAVESGAADAAIVYRSDLSIAKSLRVAFEPEGQPKIVYPLAVLKHAGPAARAFAGRLSGDEGRAVFTRWGFSPP